jgi:serine/threonine protein phosphatase PrpC
MVETNQKRENDTYSLNFLRADVTRISLGYAQTKGKRDYQEDSFGYGKSGEAAFTAVVADGMGGLVDGDEISTFVVSAMLKRSDKMEDLEPIAPQLSAVVQHINRKAMKKHMKGGSTLAAVYCNPEGIFWCCVGDSRIYLFRNGRLTQLNEDCDYLNQLFDKLIEGSITYREAAGNSQKDSLAQYIGMKGAITPDCNLRPLLPQKQDKILICSDGVYNSLDETELGELLKQPAQTAADAILGRNLEKDIPHQDNFTAVVLEFT